MNQLVTIICGRRIGKSTIQKVAQIFNVAWHEVTQEQALFAISQMTFMPTYYHLTNAIQAVRDSQLSKPERFIKWYGASPQTIYKDGWNICKIDFAKLEEYTEKYLRNDNNE